MQNKGWLKELSDLPFKDLRTVSGTGEAQRLSVVFGPVESSVPRYYTGRRKLGSSAMPCGPFRFRVSLFIPTTRKKDTVIIKGLLGNLGSVTSVRSRTLRLLAQQPREGYRYSCYCIA